MTEREELKPCPFCGGKAQMCYGSTNYGYGVRFDYNVVKCTSCGASGQERDVDLDASAAWNRRAEG